KIDVGRSCLVALNDADVNVYKSLRNIPRVEALEVEQLNAGIICNRRKLLFTRQALESLLNVGEGDKTEDTLSG
ncbi:MAG: 50S ribosomal protein L4, partial [Sedimentisphaerales bacterium]|nr:50S ribosomal protein L4 [Sedimentisphaerales bacterium]